MVWVLFLALILSGKLKELYLCLQILFTLAFDYLIELQKFLFQGIETAFLGSGELLLEGF